MTLLIKKEELRLLILDNNPNSYEHFRVKYRSEPPVPIRRTVSDMSTLNTVLVHGEVDFHFMFVLAPIQFSVYSQKNKYCPPVHTARMVAARLERKRSMQPSFKLPLIVLAYEKFDDSELWFDILNAAKIPWVVCKGPEEILWFNDTLDDKEDGDNAEVLVHS
jgi:hypothetical protein